MDEFDESVEATGEGSGSKLVVVAMLIGLVGIVVGVTGIILANQAQKAVKTMQSELASQPDKTPDLEKQISSINERLEKLGGEFVKLGRQDRQLQENTQSAFDSVLRDVKANREGINQVTEKMSDLVEKLENWKPTTATVARTSTAERPSGSSGDSRDSGDGEAAAAGPEDGIYAVQSGDTLSGIAKRFGVSLSALQAANPTVNPRAMRIGQKIVIPE